MGWAISSGRAVFPVVWAASLVGQRRGARLERRRISRAATAPPISIACIAYNRAGERVELGRGDVEFAYRKSSLGELVVTEATFALQPAFELEQTLAPQSGDSGAFGKTAQFAAGQRGFGGLHLEKPGRARTAPGRARLIQQLGLKGAQIGGAQISALHGNFLVNHGRRRRRCARPGQSHRGAGAKRANRHRTGTRSEISVIR